MKKVFSVVLIVAALLYALGTTACGPLVSPPDDRATQNGGTGTGGTDIDGGDTETGTGGGDTETGGGSGGTGSGGTETGGGSGGDGTGTGGGSDGSGTGGDGSGSGGGSGDGSGGGSGTGGDGTGTGGGGSGGDGTGTGSGGDGTGTGGGSGGTGTGGGSGGDGTGTGGGSGGTGTGGGSGGDGTGTGGGDGTGTGGSDGSGSGGTGGGSGGTGGSGGGGDGSGTGSGGSGGDGTGSGGGSGGGWVGNMRSIQFIRSDTGNGNNNIKWIAVFKITNPSMYPLSAANLQNGEGPSLTIGGTVGESTAYSPPGTERAVMGMFFAGSTPGVKVFDADYFDKGIVAAGASFNYKGNVRQAFIPAANNERYLICYSKTYVATSASDLVGYTKYNYFVLDMPTVLARIKAGDPINIWVNFSQGTIRYAPGNALP